MSCPDDKKCHKEKIATVFPSKRKEHRRKVIKKIVQVTCPPPEVNVTTPTVVGATGL